MKLNLNKTGKTVFCINTLPDNVFIKKLHRLILKDDLLIFSDPLKCSVTKYWIYFAFSTADRIRYIVINLKKDPVLELRHWKHGKRWTMKYEGCPDSFVYFHQTLSNCDPNIESLFARV